ncbi:MAG TPA: hypothetical protein VMX54_15625 [Vicinamibacteria bacterium]|nr:hypothetical protein [Vicinamibacteria bacterium]
MRPDQVRAQLQALVDESGLVDLAALAGVLEELKLRILLRLSAPEVYLSAEDAAEQSCIPLRTLRRLARRRASAAWARWPSRRLLIVSKRPFEAWLATANGRRAAHSPENRAPGPTRTCSDRPEGRLAGVRG